MHTSQKYLFKESYGIMTWFNFIYMTLKCTNNIMDIFIATTSIKTYMGKIQSKIRRILSYNVIAWGKGSLQSHKYFLEKKRERNRNRLLFRFAENGEEIQRFCFTTLYSCLSYTLILKKKKTGFLILQQQYWKVR